MGTTARQRFQLLRAEMMVQNAFYNLRDAGDALMDAGCSPKALAVHGLAAQAAPLATIPVFLRDARHADWIGAL